MQVVLRTDFHCSDVESGSLAMLWMNTVCESLALEHYHRISREEIKQLMLKQLMSSYQLLWWMFTSFKGGRGS